MKSDVVCRSVFIVDESPCVLAGIKSMIGTEKDLKVVGAAETGRAAIEGIRRAEPDLIVMDLFVPDMGGIDLLKELHAQFPVTRTLVLTFKEDTALMEQAIGAGASGYVTKRSTEPEMMHAIRAVLSGGVYLEPKIAGSFIMAPAVAADASESILSDREFEVIKLVAKGFMNKEVSSALSLSVKTVETYRARAMAKLGLGTRAKIVELALREGWMN